MDSEARAANWYMRVWWYAVVDDLIGGWAVATADKPTSQLFVTKESDEWEVGSFISEEAARHIAETHNQTITGR